jgi:hypothetical protein
MRLRTWLDKSNSKHDTALLNRIEQRKHKVAALAEAHNWLRRWDRIKRELTSGNLDEASLDSDLDTLRKLLAVLSEEVVHPG